MLNSGRDMPITLAHTVNGKAKIWRPVSDELLYALKDLKIDVMSVDPFVSSHTVTENDAVAMETVMTEWANLCEHGKSSVHLVHHNRKTAGGVAGTIDDTRGSTAIINKARVRRAVNKMTASQAKGAGIKEAERGFYISADLANTNVMKPAAALDWYKLESVDLENMTIDQPSDEIGVPTIFDYVAIEAVETTPEQGDAVLKALRTRDDWRTDPRSPEWIGAEIGRQLGLVMIGPSHAKERKRVGKIIADWLADGTLTEYQAKDANRIERAFAKVVHQSSVVASVTDAD